MPPLLAGTLAGLLVTWVDLHALLPLGLSRRPLCGSAARRALRSGPRLTAVTAAVVGVILNLAVWFGVHVIFRETVPWHGFGLI